LKIPSAGYRLDDGNISSETDVVGVYWTSEASAASDFAKTFDTFTTDEQDQVPVYGHSVRCIKPLTY